MLPVSKIWMGVAVVATSDLAALMLINVREWIAANLFLVCGVVAERLKLSR